MKNLKIILFLVIILSLSNCTDDPENNVCNNRFVDFVTNTTFSSANGYTLFESYDLQVHEYTIQINADGEICTIGYKSPPTFTGTYKMELITSGNTILYSGTHSFSETAIDYQSITPIPISSGTVITVRRTVLSGATTTSHLIGQIYKKTDGSDIPFPIPEGNVIFIGSSFYDVGGVSSPHTKLQPLIGLGFKMN